MHSLNSRQKECQPSESKTKRFNRTFRQDVLHSYIFENLTAIIKYANAWVWLYNNVPHSSLGQLTPVKFLM
ncbi:integrase core domain-containing protein [Sphingobacterium spiritivorum]|uniref:integrase core domain-containing protein n=1 Tax=Sphingobacterium spiritivorum TaxID=258 RepID=UPI000E0E941B